MYVSVHDTERFIDEPQVTCVFACRAGFLFQLGHLQTGQRMMRAQRHGLTMPGGFLMESYKTCTERRMDP